MPGAADDPRGYLLDRFRTDAETLRDRTTALESGAVRPGPDVATSRAMAAACDAVVALLDALAPSDQIPSLASIQAMVPRLQALATHSAAQPAVRAVYAGAITRIRDLGPGTDG
jgi:hypothetical protein